MKRRESDSGRRRKSKRSGARERTSRSKDGDSVPATDRDRESAPSSERSDPVAALHRSVGNQAVQRLHREGRLRGRTADRRGEGGSERGTERIDRSASDEGGGSAGGPDGSAGGAGVPDAVRDVISSSGRSMDDTVQREMESKMGGEFGDVRIHTGSKAAEAAESIDARAFTVGNHVAFNSGEYGPGTDEGKRTLAHELTHVRQQTDGRVSLLSKTDTDHPGTDAPHRAALPGHKKETIVQPKLEMSSPNDPAEKEAERVAQQVVRMDDESGAARTGAGGISDIQQRSVGRVVQRETSSESGGGGPNRSPVGSLSPSNKLLDFIKSHEGMPKVGGMFEDQIPDVDHEGNSINYQKDVVPYDDPKGLATIGVGHLIANKSCNQARADGDMPERFNLGITEAEALSLLKKDAQEFGDALKGDVTVTLAQHEYDALVDWLFGVGTEWIAKGSVIEKVNRRAHKEVANTLLEYEDPPGSLRPSEAAMYMYGTYNYPQSYSGDGKRDGSGGGSEEEDEGGSEEEGDGGGSRFGIYRVQEGDSLWAIANRFDIDGGPKQIAEWNDMAVDDPIHPDDKLKLPAEKLPDGGSSDGGGASGGASPKGEADLAWGEIREAFAEAGKDVAEVADWILENLDEIRQAWIEAGEEIGEFAVWIEEQFDGGDESKEGGGKEKEGDGQRKAVMAVIENRFGGYGGILRTAFEASEPNLRPEGIAANLKEDADEIKTALSIIDSIPKHWDSVTPSAIEMGEILWTNSVDDLKDPLTDGQKAQLVQALLFPYPRPDLPPKIISGIYSFDAKENPRGLRKAPRMDLLRAIQRPTGSRKGSEWLQLPGRSRRGTGEGDAEGGYLEATEENVNDFVSTMNGYIGGKAGLGFDGKMLLNQSTDISDKADSDYQILPPREIWGNIEPTLQVVSDIAKRGGTTVSSVESVYRSTFDNACAGGSGGSTHQEFAALDISASETDFRNHLETMLRGDKYAAQLANEMGVSGLGIGLYGSGRTHVDVRNSSYKW